MKYVDDVYYEKDSKLPTFFKILKSKRQKVNGKFDHLLLVDRFKLNINCVELLDTYNMWFNKDFKGKLKAVTPEILKAVKKKYKIKKGLHKIRPKEDEC